MSSQFGLTPQGFKIKRLPAPDQRDDIGLCIDGTRRVGIPVKMNRE